MTDTEIIRGQIQHWAQAVRAKDIDGILAHHADKILLFDVVVPLQSSGITAYRDSWETLFFPWYGDNGSFDLHDLTVHAGDRVAFCHAIIKCSGTEHGQLVHFTLRLTIGLEKIDGEWQVLHEHHSEPLPLP
jgi:ketosteroid isomerase-like protein